MVSKPPSPQSPYPKKQTAASLIPEEEDMDFNSIGVVCVCELNSEEAKATAGTKSKVTEDKSKFRIIILPTFKVKVHI